MSEAVNIVIGVIEQMNLSTEDRLKLADMLNEGVAARKPIQPKKMSDKEIYRRRFEKWVVEKKILFPPKN